MIGTLDPTDKNAVIIGAGISGLLLGYALKKNGFSVQILEASSRPGGLIETVRTPYGLVEKAAHSLLVTPEAKQFFNELGVELIPVAKDAKARYIYRNGKMRRMPLRFSEILQTLFHFFSKPKPAFSSDTGTLEEWGYAYLGPPATRYLLAPFITGIFATAPHRLLAKLAFPKLVPASPDLSLFRHFKKRPRSARPVMMTPKDGMESLVQVLTTALKSEIKLNHSVSELPSSQNIILSIPTAALSKLIRKEDAASAEKLIQIPYAPLISITCFFKKDDFQKSPKGVGVLVPRNEGLRLLGCLFNSSSFENRVTHPHDQSFTVMYGGTEDPSALSLSDEALTELVHRELRILLNTKAHPHAAFITRWDRAIPIYGQELKAAQDSLKRGFCAIPGRIVFNNYSEEVSIRGLINASLHL